mmetsp:Transcript_67797/g.214538  ORF Transcript_67797/g.214538 Transcript_67797/m.214538 type:complete len:169 (-) Transcript_67797:383-889(-)
MDSSTLSAVNATATPAMGDSTRPTASGDHAPASPSAASTEDALAVPLSPTVGESSPVVPRGKLPFGVTGGQGGEQTPKAIHVLDLDETSDDQPPQKRPVRWGEAASHEQGNPAIEGGVMKLSGAAPSFHHTNSGGVSGLAAYHASGPVPMMGEVGAVVAEPAGDVCDA